VPMSSRRIVATLTCVVVLLTAPAVHSGKDGQPRANGPILVDAVSGILLDRVDGGWGSLKAGSALPKNKLVVALFRSELRSANDAVGLSLIADVGQRGPFPVLEAAI